MQLMKALSSLRWPALQLVPPSQNSKTQPVLEGALGQNVTLWRGKGWLVPRIY